MTAPRCGGHSGLGPGAGVTGPQGSLGSGAGLLMAATASSGHGQNILGTPEQSSEQSSEQTSEQSSGSVTILPVTAENLAKLDSSRDIDLSFPITSTYLRQMRHRPEPEMTNAVGAAPEDEDDEVGPNSIVYPVSGQS